VAKTQAVTRQQAQADALGSEFARERQALMTELEQAREELASALQAEASVRTKLEAERLASEEAAYESNVAASALHEQIARLERAAREGFAADVQRDAELRAAVQAVEVLSQQIEAPGRELVGRAHAEAADLHRADVRVGAGEDSCQNSGPSCLVHPRSVAAISPSPSFRTSSGSAGNPYRSMLAPAISTGRPPIRCSSPSTSPGYASPPLGISLTEDLCKIERALRDAESKFSDMAMASLQSHSTPEPPIVQELSEWTTLAKQAIHATSSAQTILTSLRRHCVQSPARYLPSASTMNECGGSSATPVVVSRREGPGQGENSTFSPVGTTTSDAYAEIQRLRRQLLEFQFIYAVESANYSPPSRNYY
jgi:hypothetical protein